MTREEIPQFKTLEEEKEYWESKGPLEAQREEIREGIALNYLQWKENGTTLQLDAIDKFLSSECFEFADEVMKREHSQGVVIQVDTRWYVSNGKYLNPLTDKPVRVVAVEPLIEICEHEWIKLRNEVITSGEICTKCKAIRPETAKPLVAKSND